MSVYLRGSTYYTRFSIKGNKINRSTGTSDKAEAEQYEAQLKRDLWGQIHLGEKPRRIWQEAVTSWIKAKQHNRSLDDDLAKLAWLSEHFNNLPLPSISSEKVEETLDRKSHSNATRNRYYAVIRGVLKRAHRLGWIDAVPALQTREEPSRTPRFMTPAQAAKLIAQLDTPRRKHISDMVRFSLATGLREANVTGLTWGQIDRANKYMYVTAQNAKAKRTLRIPLNSQALAVLESRAGIHKTYVFTYRGKPVKKANRDGFVAAKKKAGVPWLRWHDLRHTWASWHAMAGTPLMVLKDLGGWSDLSMVMRYAHLAPDYMDGFAENSVQKVLQGQTDKIVKKSASN